MREAPPIDHIGLVVADLDASVLRWRAAGFQVSDPEPLMTVAVDGAPRPLGQRSAHIVFENAYVELSSPDPGSGNHLEPMLALGEGVRIVVFSADSVEVAHEACVRAGLAAGGVMEASRTVRAGQESGTARFRWFPLTDRFWSGVLAAVVEHVTPGLVFHPALIRHANGCRRIAAFVAQGDVGTLRRLPDLPAVGRAPLRLADPAGPLRITGMACLANEAGPERFFAFDAPGEG